MAMTRSMTAKKRLKTVENDDGSASWSYMNRDILLSIIWRLGVIDFIACSGVCKQWRTAANSIKDMFMSSRQPLSICISTQVARKKQCYLDDFQGRKFKTIIPNSAGRICIGLVSGYLILFRRNIRDFRLVNPITRHELNFPGFPFRIVATRDNLRCALVFSPAMSSWVFLISTRSSRKVSFSLSGKPGKWTHLFSDFQICDIFFFQGKVYTLNTGLRLFEVKLGHTPTLTLLKTKNVLKSELIYPEFEIVDKKLYVMGYYLPERNYVSVEIDFDQMVWMKPSSLFEKYGCYASILKCGLIKLELWMDPCEQYERLGYFHCTNRIENTCIRFTPDLWYCPHKCLDDNRLHE